MASSSSLGNASLANAGSAQVFYTHFRSATASLLEELAGVSSKEGLQDALSKYAALSADLTKAVDSGVLPAHDRGVHKKGLEEVAAVLEEKRKKVESGGVQGGKKAGFSFKRNKPPSAVPKATTAAVAAEPTQPSQVVPTVEAESSKQPTIETRTISSDSSHLIISSLHNTNHTCSGQGATSSTLSLDLSHITNSFVDLRHLASTSSILSVQLRSVSDSILLLPPIDGSIMIYALTGSLLTVPSCHQFRMHESADTLIELSTKRDSVATVEGCKRITFVTGAQGIKVQDFDDLFNSEQLKHQHGAKGNSNFSIVTSEQTALADLATRLAAKEGLTVKECIQSVCKEIGVEQAA